MAQLRAIEAGASTPGPSGPPPPPPPSPEPPKGRRGGLLDLLAVAAAVYTLVVSTPVGGLAERGFHWVLGRRVHTRPLVTYFRIGPGGAGVEARAVEQLAQAPAREASTTPAARRAGVDPDVARSLALILSGGAQEGGHFAVALPPAAASSFAAVGAAAAGEGASAKAREAALLEGLGKLQAELTSPEAAVAALAVELPRVRYAIRRARAEGAAEPSAYASFRAYLPPDDRAEADPVVHGTFALVTAFGMKWPVPRRARVSSPFGWREHPVLGRRKKHTGIDLAVPTGTPVVAVADGRVLYTARDGVNGRFLKLDHGHGLTSIYCHNDEVLVRRGDQVGRGDVVAKSGATGRVSGPHLHFQMEIDDVPVDPALFHRARGGRRMQEASSVRTATTAAR